MVPVVEKPSIPAAHNAVCIQKNAPAEAQRPKRGRPYTTRVVVRYWMFSSEKESMPLKTSMASWTS